MFKEEAKVKLSPFWTSKEMKANVKVISASLEKNYTNTMIHLVQSGIESYLKDKAKKSTPYTEDANPVPINDAVEKPKKPVNTRGPSDFEKLKSDIDDFDIFWKAGMAKNNRKKAFSLFESLAPKHGGTFEFAKMLREDINERINVGQMGFDAMHPTTYLNGERWNDEIKTPPLLNAGVSVVDQSAFVGSTDQSKIIEGQLANSPVRLDHEPDF